MYSQLSDTVLAFQTVNQLLMPSFIQNKMAAVCQSEVISSILR